MMSSIEFSFLVVFFSEIFHFFRSLLLMVESVCNYFVQVIKLHCNE